MTVLEELSAAARAAADRVGPSVVRIGTHGGRGCGIVIAPGLVATNAHNLRDRTTAVTFADGRQVQGELAGADVEGDLAVLKVDTADAPPADLSGEPAQPGDVVFAVARAAAGGTRISFGLVSGTERAFRGPRGRRIRGSVEHTAPLPRGSSGSPLVDAGGKVVGLSTHRIGDGFYLALPADEDLRSRIDGLAEGRSRQRVTLGVGLAPAGVARKLRRSVGLPDRDGLLVRGVEDGSPAAAAGIAQGDLLVAAGGRDLTAVDDLFDVLDAAEPGGTLEVTVVRGTEERVVTVSFPAE
jgi:S1-C subfamily serine protease